MNSTWRESGDQKGWVQHSPWVRRRSAGIGVGLGTGVTVGVELGDKVGSGAGIAGVGDDLMVGVAVTWDVCDPGDDVALGLGTGVLVQPVTTSTVTRAELQSAWAHLRGFRVSIIIQ